MKVYLATEGSYSDYRVLGVFSRKEDAEKVGYAEEYELYDSIPKALTVYAIHVIRGQKPSHTTHIVRPWDYGWDWLNRNRRPRFDEWSQGWRVSGTNKLAVEKAFRDRLGMKEAEAAGIG